MRNTRAAPSSTSRRAVCARSPSATSAAPIRAEKKMICSTLPSLNAAKGLVGTMPSSTSSGVGITRSFTSPSGRLDRPTPGLIRCPNAKPTSTASRDVMANQTRVRTPSRTAPTPSPSLAMELAMVNSTRGATTMRIRFR
ncbi:hypothetical protein D3C86_1179830 [compost metagenome]